MNERGSRVSEGVRAYEHVSVDFSTHMLLYFHAIHDVTKNASDKQSTNGEMTAGERAAKRESAREGGSGGASACRSRSKSRSTPTVRRPDDKD